MKIDNTRGWWLVFSAVDLYSILQPIWQPTFILHCILLLQIGILIEYVIQLATVNFNNEVRSNIRYFNSRYSRFESQQCAVSREKRF